MQTPKYEQLRQNVQELQKAYLAVHESVFRFSWKKLWPFNLFLPQVDFLRAKRLLKDTQGQLSNQLKFLKNALNSNPKQIIKDYYQQMDLYLKQFSTCIKILDEICTLKQDQIEKKRTHTLSSFNKIIKQYQAENAKMSTLAHPLLLSLKALREVEK